ncbi:hypothetical protein F2P56_012942 [Juglans regia]|uniref:RNase H type-1 domain-containing protein n=2 Tax=Juglans regia TaxID=51240 RepID=A0A833XPW5_JUGRE|nr:uncharacterized protein LOC108999435 [Juglans regia]KAF5468825.1 hypothetical protein F2P56_012942 [Juglans regia]
MWKVKLDCLPVDDRVRRLGILLVSKCDCWILGHEESIDHILNSGDIAHKVWEMAAVAVGIPNVTVNSWWARVSLWFSCTKRSSQKGCLIGLLPSIITWKLWGRWCKARMEKKYMMVSEVWFAVRCWCQWFSALISSVSSCLEGDKIILRSLDIPVQPVKHKKFLVITWCKPPSGWVKLNVDGSSRDNPSQCGGGGVIRNSGGEMLLAFLANFGHSTNNEAELRALIFWVAACKAGGYSFVEIESDSQVAVNWLKFGVCIMWYLCDFWEEFLSELQGLNFSIRHQFREGNKAADFLAQ